jgi:hypothetical protein
VPIVWWVFLLFCWFSFRFIPLRYISRLTPRFKFQVSSCANYTKWYSI